MAYDEDLANRVRELIGAQRGVGEKRMFGGLAFLVNGNMALAVSRHGGIMVRVDPARSAKLTAGRHVEPTVMRGREMPGWLRVSPEGLKTKRELSRWVERGFSHARSLPAK